MNKHKKKLKENCVHLYELAKGTKIYSCDAYDIYHFRHYYPQCKICEKFKEIKS